MQQIIQYATDHLAAIILIWQSLFIALAGFCELVGWTQMSKLFGTFSTFDLGRAVRYAKAFFDMLDASRKAKAAAARIIRTSIVFLLILPGCSLEAARQARINSQLRAGTYTAQTRTEAECKALDNVHVYTAYGAELSLGVGTAAGVLAAADTSKEVRQVAIGTGIGAGVVAAGLGAWSASSGKAWTEQCSQ